MPKLRALVVDDAVVMRRLLTEVLQRDPQIEVGGTAPNGRIALQKIPQLNPDFLTLDMEMPEMDGLETLRELRRTHPKLPVIMLSLLTKRGGAFTLDALAAGANDYVTKPVDSSNLAESIARLEAELLPKIHAHCVTRTPPPPTAPAPAVPASATPAGAGPSTAPLDLVCIATSTGGPNALFDLFTGFTSPLRVPLAIVQHMPPMFTQMLADRLNAIPGPVRCREAAEGDVLAPGCAYIAPGGKHLSLTRLQSGAFVAHLLETPPENSCRPAADVLFRSAAATHAHILGVVMTGMGQDGLRGCEHLHERRGQIIVQDQATSVVWGMPGAVAHAGLAQAILPLPALAAEITRRVATFKSPPP